MIGLDIAGRDHDAGVDGGRASLHRWRDRDRGVPARRNDLDPPHLPVGEGFVGAQLEPQRVDVELERTILVGSRHGYAADLGQVQVAGHVISFWLLDGMSYLRPAPLARVIAHRRAPHVSRASTSFDPARLSTLPSRLDGTHGEERP